MKVLDQRNHKKVYDKLKEDRQATEIDFGDTPYKLQEYLDVYNGVKSEVLSTTKFDRNFNLSTTYLGRINIIRFDQLKVEEKFPI